MITYYAGDERPSWVATITLNGGTEDYTSGFTFEVKVLGNGGASLLTKTTGITGSLGAVTVAWAAGELALAPGYYTAQLRVTRVSDGLDFTLTEPMTILHRS